MLYCRNTKIWSSFFLNPEINITKLQRKEKSLSTVAIQIFELLSFSNPEIKIKKLQRKEKSLSIVAITKV